MSTLGILKAQIADDLARSDVTTQIAAEINSAINHYKATRFYFSDTRTATFVTVAGQSTYSSSDDAEIPLFIKIDEMFLEDSGGTSYRLKRYSPEEIEPLLDASAASGRPYAYAYFSRTFRFYPKPDAIYTVRPVGHIEIAAPAADDTAGNAWMTEAYELLRCRAKAYLYLHVIDAPEKAGLMLKAEDDALSRLLGLTTDRVAMREIEKTEW